MTRIRIIGLAVFAVFAIVAVAASSASALEWLLNGKPITTAVPVTSTGTLLLEDLSATGGAVAILCKGTDKGTVGPGALDEITSITATGCTFDNKTHGICEESAAPNAKAVNIAKGWMTLLLTVGGQNRDMITGNEAGKNPGWSVECTVSKVIKVTDTCTTANGDPLVANVAGGAGVLATFEASETASCTEGTSTSGMVTGPDLTESPKTTDIITISNSEAT